MLSRILEKEVMDTPDEARDYDAMDHRAVNLRFVEDFLREWNGANPVLDLGTGTAQIPILLCQLAPSAEVVAVDDAENMLALARRNIDQAGLKERIQPVRADAKKLDFEDRTFSAVISNSIIHHIPEPHLVFREMVRVVQSPGLLFVRDLLRPASADELQHLVQTYAGNDNAHQRQMFADSLHAALTLSEVRALVKKMGFPESTVQETSDRHWTWVSLGSTGFQPMRVA